MFFHISNLAPIYENVRSDFYKFKRPLSKILLTGFLIFLFGPEQVFAKKDPVVDLHCPQINFGQGSELKEYKTFATQGYQILICVPPKDVNQGQLTRQHLFQFEAHLFKKNKYIKKIFTGSQKTAIAFERRKGLLFEISHLNLFEKFYPLFESQIHCQNDDCQRQTKKCVFRQSLQPAMSPQDFAKEKELVAKVEAREKELDGSDIFDFLQFALKGRERGIQFFTKMELLPKMNSAGLQIYKNIQKVVETMVVEDCLKLESSQSENLEK